MNQQKSLYTNNKQIYAYKELLPKKLVILGDTW